MTVWLSHYKFSRKQIARFTCNDCGVNVVKIGDFCMLKPQIWEGVLGLGWNDNLCVRCIEARLGRQLGLFDFGAPASVEGYPVSDTLVSRLGLGGEKLKTQDQTKDAAMTDYEIIKVAECWRVRQNRRVISTHQTKWDATAAVKRYHAADKHKTNHT
jgi:hypothetical protein